MLDQDTRTAALRLHREGHGRAIGRTLNISRNSVKAILSNGHAAVPVPERPEQAALHADAIVELFIACKGNLVRVAEDLTARGIDLPYSTLTAFCRRHAIGTKPKCDIYSLSKMLGHSDIKTTTIYLAASSQHLQAQMRKHPLN